jgi:hypothetical protein
VTEIAGEPKEVVDQINRGAILERAGRILLAVENLTKITNKKQLRLNPQVAHRLLLQRMTKRKIRMKSRNLSLVQWESQEVGLQSKLSNLLLLKRNRKKVQAVPHQAAALHHLIVMVVHQAHQVHHQLTVRKKEDV